MSGRLVLYVHPVNSVLDNKRVYWVAMCILDGDIIKNQSK